MKFGLIKKAVLIKNIIFILCCFFLAACSGNDKNSEKKTEKKTEESLKMRIIDDWLFHDGRRLVIMSLKANGNWVAQVRVQEKFSNVVGKKGEQKGTWKLSGDDKYLEVLVANGDDLKMEWTPGENYKYLISSLDDSKLVLAWEDSGKKIEWNRLGAKKKQDPSSAESEEGKKTLITTRTTKMSPLIVNFKKRSPYSRDRYVCTSFTIIEDLETPVEKDEKIPVHPAIRDNILFYLSALEYKELNTFNEVRSVTEDLKKIISPYFSGRLKEFKLDHIIVAGSKGSFEEFIIQYPEQMTRFGFENQAPAAPVEEEGKEKKPAK